LKHERVTEELRGIAALYALGSLTQQEARSFENHIREGCSICEAERLKHERAVTAMGLSADEAVPPEYIRDLLLARIEREPKAVPPAVPASQAVEQRPAMEPRRPNPPALPLMSQPQNNRSNLFPWVLVVVLAILGLLGAYAWKSSRELNTLLQAKISASQADTDKMRSQLDNHKANSGNLEQILSTLGKPGVRIARLVSQTVPPTSSAAIIWDSEKSNCLILGNFPPPPAGKNYQLWFFTPIAKVSAGSFKIGSSNRVFVMIPIPKDAVNAGVAVVTLEPDIGSQIPTSPYYAIGRIE
jgi:hypothetical protein